MAEFAVRRATVADAETIGRLLHDFNSEFDDPTPGPRALAERFRELLAGDETMVLLGGDGPFAAGLYAVTEMFVDDEGIINPACASTLKTARTAPPSRGIRSAPYTLMEVVARVKPARSVRPTPHHMTACRFMRGCEP